MDLKIVAVSLCIGAAFGSAGTYVVFSPRTTGSSGKAAELSKTTLRVPTAEEAARAIDAFNRHDPLRYGDPKPVTVSLGQCGPNPAGAGISCMTTIHDPDKTRPIDKEVGYAQSADGRWAVNRY